MLADLNRVASFCSNGRLTGTTTTKLKNQWMMDIWTNFKWFHPFSVFDGDWRFDECRFVRLLPFDPFPLWRREHFLTVGAPSGDDDARICQHDAASQRRGRGRIDVGSSVPCSGSSASLLRCLPSLNRRLATTTAVNNICSTRWPTAVRPTTSNVPNWVDFDSSTTTKLKLNELIRVKLSKEILPVASGK